jgi:cytochrome c oxidase cbb3-type subunit 3
MIFVERVAIGILTLGTAAMQVSAQGRGARSGPDVPGRPVDITQGARFNRDAVTRGEKAFGENCARCHGANARGGKGRTEVDLLRSAMVLDDVNGREITEFLSFGRPDKGMPKFDLPPATASDIALWLHRNITSASERGTYERMNVFTGDAKAGEAFFKGGTGKCSTCHSETGDMKGLAARNSNDSSTIQGLIVSGGGGGGRGRGGRGGRGGGAITPSKTATTATVTLASGEKITGYPVLINDFTITIQQLANGEQRSWLRDAEWPKVTLTNPLQTHVDLSFKYSDADIHNLAAYLKTLN